MIKDKIIFITGGAGFIANTIISKLIESNKIIVYDNFTRDSLTSSEFYHHRNLKIINGDVLDLKKLSNSLIDVDVVIHMAAIVGINTVLKNSVQTMNVNITGTRNVLEVSKINQIKDKFINFSTSEIFGNYAYKPDEDSDAIISGSAGHARWSYAVSKLAGEHLTQAYHREFNLPSVSVRPFNIYGPGQTGEGALQKFIIKALYNNEIEIHGDGNQIRAWCYIDDFVDCICKILENDHSIGKIFNIGNPRTILTIYGLAQTICRVLNSKSIIKFVEPLSADVELRIPAIDKAKEILNFKPKIDVEEGIIKTTEWIKKNIKKFVN